MPIDELAISGAKPRRERETSAEAVRTQTASHDLTRCTAPHLHHDWAPFGSSAARTTDTASAPVGRACAQAERAATSRDALQDGTIRCTAEQAPQPSTCAIDWAEHRCPRPRTQHQRTAAPRGCADFQGAAVRWQCEAERRPGTVRSGVSPVPAQMWRGASVPLCSLRCASAGRCA
jgi:hypothetical protein